MHVLRWLRIFIPILLVAAIVAATVIVLTSRSELQTSHEQVETTWVPLRRALNERYDALITANRAVRTIPGPLHAIVTEVADANADWNTLERDGSVTAQVNAANRLESLGRRLVFAARRAPRLAGDAVALGTIEAYALLAKPDAADPFNDSVDHFERSRNRPARQIAARILGYDSIPAYDSTPAVVATTPSSGPAVTTTTTPTTASTTAP